jgi:NAD-dependent deacetylase
MDLHRLRQQIGDNSQIVFFGGAGTSTESGIPDFRSADGLFRTQVGAYSPEEILSRDFFMNHVEDFYAFYKQKMLYPDVQPNRGHKVLAELERQGRLQALITQNIDGLHQKAGNRNVLELHGTVHRNHCVDCRTGYTLDDVYRSGDRAPRCRSCGGIIKPDVVLYQEGLDMDLLHRAIAYIEQADVLIVAGTSLTVQPAASLVRHYRGDKMILINKSATAYDEMADAVIASGFSETMESLFV